MCQTRPCVSDICCQQSLLPIKCLSLVNTVHTNLYSSIFLAMCFTFKSAIGRWIYICLCVHLRLFVKVFRLSPMKCVAKSKTTQQLSIFSSNSRCFHRAAHLKKNTWRYSQEQGRLSPPSRYLSNEESVFRNHLSRQYKIRVYYIDKFVKK